MGGGSSAPATPESEKEAKRNALRMVNIGGELQGKVYDGFSKALERESGHREAGSTSADMASMSEKQLKSIQADPVAVANTATELASGLDSSTFTSKASASINDVNREMGGAKAGVNSQIKNANGQTLLAVIANQAAMAKAKLAQERNEQLLNAAGVAAAYGVNKYQDYQAETRASPSSNQYLVKGMKH